MTFLKKVMDSTSKYTSLNICQWNSQSLRPKLNSFELFLNQEKMHIAILSETWFDPNVTFNLTGYNIFRKDRPDSYGGVAIIIHKSLQTRISPVHLSNQGIEIIHVKILNCESLKSVVSIYCPSSVVTRSADWDRLFELATAKYRLGLNSMLY